MNMELTDRIPLRNTSFLDDLAASPSLRQRSSLARQTLTERDARVIKDASPLKHPLSEEQRIKLALQDFIDMNTRKGRPPTFQAMLAAGFHGSDLARHLPDPGK